MFRYDDVCKNALVYQEESSKQWFQSVAICVYKNCQLLFLYTKVVIYYLCIQKFSYVFVCKRLSFAICAYKNYHLLYMHTKVVSCYLCIQKLSFATCAYKRFHMLFVYKRLSFAICALISCHLLFVHTKVFICYLCIKGCHLLIVHTKAIPVLTQLSNFFPHTSNLNTYQHQCKVLIENNQQILC